VLKSDEGPMSGWKSLVADVDFTPFSASALRQVIRIAERNQATLHVVDVIETLVVMDLEEALSPFQADIRAGLVQDAGKTWEEFTAGVPEASGLELRRRLEAFCEPLHGEMAPAQDPVRRLRFSRSRPGHHRVRQAGRWRPHCPRHPGPNEPARPPARQHRGAHRPGRPVLHPGRQAGGVRALARTVRRGGG
jgi:hypothetical protein